MDRDADGMVTMPEVKAAMTEMGLSDEELTAAFNRRIYDAL